MESYHQARLDECHILGTFNKMLIEDEGHSNPMSVDALVLRMSGWLQSEYTAYLVRDEDGAPVGYALYRDDGDYFYLRQLFVARTQRQKGIASRFLTYLESDPLTSKPVRLEVLSGNKAARKFYERNGYTDYCVTMEKM